MSHIAKTIFYQATDAPLPIPTEYLLEPGTSPIAKFIVTTDGSLVIGPMRHGLLAALYFADPFLTTDVHVSLKNAERTLGEQILSAGFIEQNNKVSWGSTGFSITEPPDDQILRTDIEQKINEFLQ